MSFNEIIMLIVAIFFVLGCLDRCLGNKFGLGQSLESGFGFMGPIALSMVGMICFSPVIASVLQPVIVPAYQAFGIDPAMFAPTFLTADGGGYAIASQISTDAEMIRFAGLIVGTMVGSTISFTIPIGVGMIPKEDAKYFATGIMSAMIAAPFGCLFAGIACGVPVGKVVWNLIPIFILSFVIAAAIFLVASVVIKVFSVFARFMTIIITIGLAMAAFTNLTGIELLEGMTDISQGFITVGVVTLIIAGSWPLAVVLEKVLKVPLNALARLLKIDATATSGLLISLVTALPAFAEYGKMNARGKVIVATFAGTMAYMIGPHLGFISATDKTMILPMFISKISAGIIGIALAVIVESRIFKNKQENQTNMQNEPVEVITE
ncbi:ethanolamine utilization protein EutH [Agathobaculum sp. TL06]